jgi:hypothetical protein
MAPENRGQVWEERLGLNPVAPCGFAALARAAGRQSPGYGRSPLRIARPAWAINRRSMMIIMRPNSEAEGMRSKEAVLDILSPDSGTAGRCSSYRGNLGMPDAICNSFVCIAAYYILQRSIEALAAPRPRAFSVPIQSEPRPYFLYLTRFLDANRFPLRWKTL